MCNDDQVTRAVNLAANLSRLAPELGWVQSAPCTYRISIDYRHTLGTGYGFAPYETVVQVSLIADISRGRTRQD
jgi:hypothetical protein